MNNAIKFVNYVHIQTDLEWGGKQTADVVLNILNAVKEFDGRLFWTKIIDTDLHLFFMWKDASMNFMLINKDGRWDIDGYALEDEDDWKLLVKNLKHFNLWTDFKEHVSELEGEMKCQN